MLNLLAFIKSLLACFTLMGSLAIEEISPHEYTEEEICAIQAKLEFRISQMRDDVDSELGEGVFDGIVSGKIDVVEFFECDDLEAFLIENGYTPPSVEQTSQGSS